MRKVLMIVGLSLIVGVAAMAQKEPKAGKKNNTPSSTTEPATHKEGYNKEKAAAAAKAKVATMPEASTANATETGKKGSKGFLPPQFPGGQTKLDEFLKANMKYPAKAAKDRVEGDVFVKFTVQKDGTVITPKVISGLDPECDKEALRLLTIMPKWEPGQKDDEIIETQYTMYVHFVLD